MAMFIAINKSFLLSYSSRTTLGSLKPFQDSRLNTGNFHIDVRSSNSDPGRGGIPAVVAVPLRDSDRFLGRNRDEERERERERKERIG